MINTLADLTAIIMTMNESKNIENCINSINCIAKRILVIDSGSTDGTVEIAKNLNAEIYHHEFTNYASQFNWALDNTKIETTWVLRIDADERLTDSLCKEAEEAMSRHKLDDVNGIILKLKVFFLGKFIRHGGVYPFRKMMIFKNGIGRIEIRNMDEHTVLKYGRTIELNNDGLHYDFKNLNHWINKHNWYATREMQDYYEMNFGNKSNEISDKKIINTRQKKNKYYKLPKFFRAGLLFVYRYIFRLGFLDGKEGLILHFLQSFWYRFLVDAKIFEQEKYNKKFEE